MAEFEPSRFGHGVAAGTLSGGITALGLGATVVLTASLLAQGDQAERALFFATGFVVALWTLPAIAGVAAGMGAWRPTASAREAAAAGAVAGLASFILGYVLLVAAAPYLLPQAVLGGAGDANALDLADTIAPLGLGGVSVVVGSVVAYSTRWYAEPRVGPRVVPAPMPGRDVPFAGHGGAEFEAVAAPIAPAPDPRGDRHPASVQSAAPMAKVPYMFTCPRCQGEFPEDPRSPNVPECPACGFDGVPQDATASP